MSDAPSVLPALLAFVGVIALIPAALWVLKRMQTGAVGPQRAVTLIGGLTLGPRERIAIVEAQGRRWLVGVTGQSISVLAELDRGETGAPARDDGGPVPVPVPNPFAQLLDRMKRHG